MIQQTDHEEEVLCVGGCGCVGFWLQSGICFSLYPGNWGHTANRGYPQFLVRAVYSITGAIGCVKAPHLAMGVMSPVAL